MKQFRCYSELSNVKGEGTDADINRSGIDVIGLARPRSLPYSDLNENLDDLKNSQIIEDLRLLQTFAGVLQKKIRARAVFMKTPTNYISTERL